MKKCWQPVQRTYRVCCLTPMLPKQLFKDWLNGITDHDFKLDKFARVAQKAVRYYDQQDQDGFQTACQWLEGAFDNKEIAAAWENSR